MSSESSKKAIEFLAMTNALTHSIGGSYMNDIFDMYTPKPRPISICSKCKHNNKKYIEVCRSSIKTLFEGTDIAIKKCSSFEELEVINEDSCFE